MEQTKQTKQPKNRKLIWGVVAFAAVAALLLGVYFATRQPAAAGSKTITVAVVQVDGATEETTITTDEEYLRGALEQENMVEGSESEYGLYVTTVNGVTADESKQQWWCVTKDGVMTDTGVDTTPIADGDHFELTLTEGY